MSHTGKDVTWNRLFRSDPNFAKGGKGRTITGDYDRGWYAALDAAREAAIRALTDDDGFVRQSELDDVLEYIDALRDDPPSLPPTKGRAHKY